MKYLLLLLLLLNIACQQQGNEKLSDDGAEAKHGSIVLNDGSSEYIQERVGDTLHIVHIDQNRTVYSMQDPRCLYRFESSYMDEDELVLIFYNYMSDQFETRRI